MHCPAFDSIVRLCATLVYVCEYVYVCVRDSRVCVCVTPSYSSKPPRNSTVRCMPCVLRRCRGRFARGKADRLVIIESEDCALHCTAGGVDL